MSSGQGHYTSSGDWTRLSRTRESIKACGLSRRREHLYRTFARRNTAQEEKMAPATHSWALLIKSCIEISVSFIFLLSNPRRHATTNRGPKQKQFLLNSKLYTCESPPGVRCDLS